MLRSTATLLWRLLAVVCVGLAILGAALPVLPTVPFLLLAAWAASRGWPELERWLLAHRRFGPPIQRWRANGAVPRNAKWFATLGMSISVAVLWQTALPLWARIGVPCMMAGVLLWLWCRPEQ